MKRTGRERIPLTSIRQATPSLYMASAFRMGMSLFFHYVVVLWPISRSIWTAKSANERWVSRICICNKELQMKPFPFEISAPNFK